ncbi:MAG: hypothetical protein ACFFCQ_07205 [Promethearchaeota archaeon]
MNTRCFMCNRHITDSDEYRVCNSCSVVYCSECAYTFDKDACWNCGETFSPENSIMEFREPEEADDVDKLRKDALKGYAKILMDLSPAFLHAAIDMAYERLRQAGYNVELNIMLKTKHGRMLVDIYARGKKGTLVILFAQNAGEGRANLMLFGQLKEEIRIKYLYVMKEDLPTNLLESAFLQRIRVIHSPERIR